MASRDVDIVGGPRKPAVIRAQTKRLNKDKVKSSIEAIYTQAGLPEPLIIYTQSPLESYFAKAAIDVFSDAKQPHAWYYHWWDRVEEGAVNIRQNAAQSILESGWQIGNPGTGYDAWCNLPVYEGDEHILWKVIPPNTRLAHDDTDDGGHWLRPLEAIGVSDEVNAAIAMNSNDMIVDMWARYRFQMAHINVKSVGGSRSMHIRMIRDKGTLLRQKNLSFFPAEITHPKTGVTLFMRDEFLTIRDLECHVMPFTGICFVSKAATKMTTDRQGRLHCENGPALEYSDGFQVFSWHGVQFPSKWISQKPEAWEALRLRNSELRRVACEMIGWDKIIDELDSEIIDRDVDPEIGELVKVMIPNVGAELFLRVICGTGRQFALPVPPDMQSAQQANAWTWGLEPSEYKPEIRT